MNYSLEKFSERLGYVFSYFLFTTVLFLVFSLLQKVPPSWNYSHFMVITIGIALLGSFIKRMLQ
ncbi:hypothetical protein K9M79_08590 [Candidatus Woesearchaeota archaeon]|nr:hypothetical protein [Candidatus Woesearchaeota archaeon]